MNVEQSKEDKLAELWKAIDLYALTSVNPMLADWYCEKVKGDLKAQLEKLVGR